MPIEFRCQQCQNLLRTPDAAAGKKARCPQCGAIQDVPAQNTTSTPVSQTPVPTTVPMQTPSPQTPANTDSVASTPPQNPYADRSVANPYTAPVAGVAQSPSSPQDARRKVMGPSIGIIATSALAMLAICLILVGGIVSVAQDGAENDDIMAFIVCGALLLVEAVICLGGVLMLMMKNYTLGLVSSVLSVIPCTMGWCIRFPFGIWALIVMFDPFVRSTFK